MTAYREAEAERLKMPAIRLVLAALIKAFC